jgi:GDPmannose 4,6-dehydratase
VQVDPKYYRPAEVDLLISDPSKAKSKIGWRTKVGFEKLVKMMIESDLK